MASAVRFARAARGHGPPPMVQSPGGGRAQPNVHVGETLSGAQDRGERRAPGVSFSRAAGIVRERRALHRWARGPRELTGLGRVMRAKRVNRTRHARGKQMVTEVSVRKAVFPVAGLGTRFLPATKSVPKEIMTLVDRPLIQYAIDEAREAGIDEFIFVTAKGKSALEDYFDSSPELERSLREKNKTDLLEALKPSEMPSGGIAYVRQQEALGLGHAVWCARRLIGDEPFAVILPDDMIAADRPCLAQMVEAHAEVGGCIVAAMEIPENDISKYGVLDIAEQKGPLVRMRGMVEKPPAAEAPSNLAVIGRYILPPSVMTNLGAMKRGTGGEVQLTDAIADEIDAGRPVHGYRFAGKRYDCGSKAGYLQATVAYALARPDLRDEFLDFLTHTVSLGRAAE
jgi:UTP--glucose-1-phosphate uridylyltransferase